MVLRFRSVMLQHSSDLSLSFDLCLVHVLLGLDDADLGYVIQGDSEVLQCMEENAKRIKDLVKHCKHDDLLIRDGRDFPFVVSSTGTDLWWLALVSWILSHSIHSYAEGEGLGVGVMEMGI
jgi:hypothetical protein